MSTLPHELILQCLNYLGEVQDGYSAASGREQLVSHTGDLSEADLQAILNNIEKVARESGDRPAVVKRFFSVMVESLQNLRAHGARGDEGSMAICVVVGMDDTHYYINTGNPLAMNRRDGLLSHVDKINAMERTKLREFYMDVLSDGTRSEKGGAGLGLITIVLRSKNKIQMKVEPINDEFGYLQMEFKIDRK